MDPSPTIDAALVRRLIAAQFPRWAHLDVVPVEPGGRDNRTFRLGPDLSVRVPSARRYVAQVAKEHRWLPELARALPVAIPAPVAMGRPSEDFPWPWSVYRWLPGETAAAAMARGTPGLATALGRFLAALQRVDAAGPPPGDHNFWRGAPLSVYDAEARQAVAALPPRLPAERVLALWDRALASTWDRPPVWLYGDVAPSNLLVERGALSAVLDFGGMAVGDPACDLAIAWTFFDGDARRTFLDTVGLDEDTRLRGRGWALWKALIALEQADREGRPAAVELERCVAALIGG